MAFVKLFYPIYREFCGLHLELALSGGGYWSNVRSRWYEGGLGGKKIKKGKKGSIVGLNSLGKESDKMFLTS
jgi:hypothetical protein